MKKLLVLMVAVVLGFAMGYFVNGLIQSEFELPSAFAAFPSVIAQEPVPKESPSDRIQMDQILVLNDRVILNVKNAQWSQFTDTHSMEPVISADSNAIQVVPQSSSEIKVGDIVSYESKYADGIFIHRVIEIGEDNDGWYAIVKGDNNPAPDPGRIRFNQIKRVVVAIVY
ncbi:MAG TPA: signal peptidase I [Candidatus Nanoarchaeia archaeon]|nr:signal peptidase I [Candidatus Nanoarchaeia archaeon]